MSEWIVSRHECGHVWTDGKTSPILGYYGQDTAEHGGCDIWESVTGRSYTTTTCTDDALVLSRGHDNQPH